MTTVPELLVQGKHAEALTAFGLTLDQQKTIVERIQAHTERYGPVELTAGVPTHHYNQLDEGWSGTNLMIMACTPTYTLRVIAYRSGSGRPEMDIDVQRGDLRNCGYPEHCTCNNDNRYDDDEDCTYCDYGRSYCMNHDNYH
jgi:hypothetical protein